MTDQELPGRLSELAGVEVLDYDCLRDTHVTLQYQGKMYDSFIWSDLMQVKGQTDILATYQSEFYAGEPAITANSYGKGQCYYIGTEPGEELMRALLMDITEKAGVEPVGTSDAQVELTAREKDSNRWIFAINYSSETKTYSVPEGYILVKGSAPGKLRGFETQILKKL